MLVSGDTTAPRGTRRTMAEQVYRALKRDLITLAFRPGASLTEQELAARYGTSRVPVREACRRLQQEGLLAAVPYKGYFVTQISMKQISDCFDLRLVLESHAVDLAAQRATGPELERLEALAVVALHRYDPEIEQRVRGHQPADAIR